MKNSIRYLLPILFIGTPLSALADTHANDFYTIAKYAKTKRQQSVINSSVLVYNDNYLNDKSEVFDLLSNFKIKYLDEYVLLDNKKIIYAIDGKIQSDDFDTLQSRLTIDQINFIKKIELYKNSDIINNFQDFQIAPENTIDDYIIVNIVIAKEEQPELLKIKNIDKYSKIPTLDDYPNFFPSYNNQSNYLEAFYEEPIYNEPMVEKIAAPSLEQEYYNYNIIDPNIGPVHYKIKLDRDYLAQKSQDSQQGLKDANSEIIQINDTLSRSEKDNYNVQLEINSQLAKNNINVKLRSKNNIFRRVWNLIPLKTEEAKNYSDSGKDNVFENNYELTSNYNLKTPIGFIHTNVNASKENFEEHYDSMGMQNSIEYKSYAANTELSEVKLDFKFDRFLNLKTLNFGSAYSSKNLSRQTSWVASDNQILTYFPNYSNGINVSEVNTEIYLENNWQPNDKIKIGSFLAAEWYDFSQDEYNNSARQFYTKPKLDLTYTPLKNLKIKLAYKKEKGKFYFGHTSFSKQVIDNNYTIPLIPETKQETRFEIEKSFYNNASFKIGISNSDTENIIALLPVYKNGQIIGQKTGNFDINTSNGLEAEAYLPLQDYIDGMSLSTSWRLKSSGILDPLAQSLASQPIQNQRSFEFNIKQDITSDNLVWGMFYKDKDGNTEYRFDEIVTNPRDTYWGMYFEYTGLEGTRIEAVFNNQINANSYSYATKFNGVRTSGDINYINFRLNNQRPALKLTLRQNL